MATATAAARTAATRDSSTTVVRKDIQGLRALAVSLVLIYHLWPQRLTGGFTGVDVFFVISGFLITSHLLAHPPGSARDLLTFWSRRVRRLLPAASIVLLAALAASRFVAPATQWANTAQQAKAAALYVVNWRLASDSVDYLAAENAPSPVQHFWSLSVEEQFYLFWPVLILVLVAIATWLHWRPAPMVLAGLSVAVVASLVYSVHDTAVEPASAYFVTPTRIWELGIGGLLAAGLSRRALGRNRDTEALPLPPAVRIVLAWLGLAALVWTGFTYTGSTPFPGWQAAVPVLGTAVVIAAYAPSAKWSPAPLLGLRPVQWLGDVSYSVYLWHWPMIVLVPYVSGDSLGRLDKAAIIAATLVLAGLTRRFVEDRFRAPKWGRPLIKPFVLGAAVMALVVGCSTAQVAEVHHRQSQAESALQTAVNGNVACFGAAAVAASPGTCPAATSGTLYPEPVQAANDRSDAYASDSGKKDCFAHPPSFGIVTCTFGDTSSAVHVALVGNSHAGEWVSAMEQIAGAHHWRLTTYLASQCAFATTLQHFDTAAHANACRHWGQQTRRDLTAAHYDLVVMTNRISVSAEGMDLESSQSAYQSGYTDELQALRSANVPVVGIRDTPAPGDSVPDCLAEHTDDFPACDGTRADWLPKEPLTDAIAAMHDPHVVEADLTRYICPSETCPAVIGRVPVYFDGSHLTATYSRTLAPYLAPYLTRALQ